MTRPGPTLEPHIGEATIGSLQAWTDGGSIYLRNTRFTSADLRSARGSVYVIDSKHPDRALALRYRTLNNAVCLASGFQASLSQEAPWAAGFSDRHAALAVAQFDENRDFFVTTDEFGDGLGELGRCCGAGCPFYSWCASLQFRLFPSGSDSGQTQEDNGISGRSGIVTDTVFLSRLQQFTNESFLIPYYTRGATFSPPAASGTAPTLRAEATEGAVHVEYAPDPSTGEAAPGEVLAPAEGNALGTVPPTNASGDAYNRTFLTLENSPQGIRLSKRDADRLVEALQEDFGKSSASGDVFATIDVAAAPGVPASRWVYTTRPFFLNVDPAYLTFLSAGLLAPRVMRFRVAMTNYDCGPDATRLDPATGRLVDHGARLTEQFVQLRTAITPRFQVTTRCVFVNPRPRDSCSRLLAHSLCSLAPAVAFWPMSAPATARPPERAP